MTCAGIFAGDDLRPLENIELDTFLSVLRVNLAGTFLAIKHALPHLRRDEGEHTGSVVTVASTAAIRGHGFGAGYTASKGGVAALTRLVAVQGGPQGIRANCICPGGVDTPMAAGSWSSDEARARLKRTVPLGCVARAEDIASVAGFLLSDDARATSPVRSSQSTGAPQSRDRLTTPFDEEGVVVVIASSLGNRLGQFGSGDIAVKILRTAVVYFAIVVLLRIFGKRELAQLNSFDLVVLLLLSNVVQNAIIGPDNSLWGGLLGAATLLFLNMIVVRVSKRWPWLDHLFEGKQNTIVTNGKYDEQELMRLGLRHGDVETAIRRQGAGSIREVKRASIEPGGAIVVQLNDADENTTRGDIERLESKLDQLIANAG